MNSKNIQDKSITIEEKKSLTSKWFQQLRDNICYIFEELENEESAAYELATRQQPGKFVKKSWQRHSDHGNNADSHNHAIEIDNNDSGGGEMSVMHGRLFEKVGVNISTVYGNLQTDFAKQIPGTENNTEFWASGISLVAHMQSPLIPAIHMNTRFIVTEKNWFGGGIDLTPIFYDAENSQYFHNQLKQVCDKYDHEYYPNFKQACDEYFTLKHRNEKRGIGGIFYDYHNNNDWEKDFSFNQDVGRAFVDIYPTIIRRHMHKKWSESQRQQQLIKRGRYVEFNLLYDRGTKFGLMTGGNIDAIFMSLPPVACW
ncbi:MAG: oxygen-dependent coproporphyrinogen oxidase [Pseudomonadota bacterium]